MNITREKMNYDLVIVGAGPSGLSAAINFKKLCKQNNKDFSVCVVEKGSEVGAHILSGAILEPRALDELVENLASREDKPHARILSNLCLYHKRENKPAYWRLFDRLESTDEDLVTDLDCLGDLIATGEKEKVTARSFEYSYTFDPNQDTKLKRGDQIKVKQDTGISVSISEMDSSKGEIVFFCTGRMEFGQRALGHRSILSDPSNIQSVYRINSAIKKRDFWMPFTPSVLFEDRNKFYKNQKNLNAKFMSMAFETTEFGRKNLKAAIHPADFTIRPQTVKREDNKSYYDLIKSFKNITKVGALLNTSLNLHGMPIALSHVDALYILLNSDLDAMVFDKIIVMKKKL